MSTPTDIDLPLLLETALCAVLAPYAADSASALSGWDLVPAHRDEKNTAVKYIMVTATNLGGPLAYVGNYDVDVQIRGVASLDGVGMAELSCAMRTIKGIFGGENDAAVLAALNATAGLGVSCYHFDYEGRTREGRDPERRRHGDSLPYVFLAHLRD